MDVSDGIIKTHKAKKSKEPKELLRIFKNDPTLRIGSIERGLSCIQIIRNDQKSLSKRTSPLRNESKPKINIKRSSIEKKKNRENIRLRDRTTSLSSSRYLDLSGQPKNLLKSVHKPNFDLYDFTPFSKETNKSKSSHVNLSNILNKVWKQYIQELRLRDINMSISRSESIPIPSPLMNHRKNRKRDVDIEEKSQFLDDKSNIEVLSTVSSQKFNEFEENDQENEDGDNNANSKFNKPFENKMKARYKIFLKFLRSKLSKQFFALNYSYISSLFTLEKIKLQIKLTKRKIKKLRKQSEKSKSKLYVGSAKNKGKKISFEMWGRIKKLKNVVAFGETSLVRKQKMTLENLKLLSFSYSVILRKYRVIFLKLNNTQTEQEFFEILNFFIIRVILSQMKEYNKIHHLIEEEINKLFRDSFFNSTFEKKLLFNFKSSKHIYKKQMAGNAKVLLYNNKIFKKGSKGGKGLKGTRKGRKITKSKMKMSNNRSPLINYLFPQYRERDFLTEYSRLNKDKMILDRLGIDIPPELLINVFENSSKDSEKPVARQVRRRSRSMIHKFGGGGSIRGFN